MIELTEAEKDFCRAFVRAGLTDPESAYAQTIAPGHAIDDVLALAVAELLSREEIELEIYT